MTTTSRKRESKIGRETTRRQLTDPCQEKKPRSLALQRATHITGYRPSAFLANVFVLGNSVSDVSVVIDRRWNTWHCIVAYSSRPRGVTRVSYPLSLSFAFETLSYVRNRTRNRLNREREL